MKGLAKRILLTTLFVGTTDLAAAYINQFVKTGKFADKLLYYIAGGALGLETSMKGGFAVGLSGLIIHYFLAFCYTLVFFIIFPKIRFLSYNKYLTGFLYGILVGAFMTIVVLPLTRLPASPFVFSKAIEGWAILGIALGIPIAISAFNFYSIEKK
jgi:hypothetical protein